MSRKKQTNVNQRIQVNEVSFTFKGNSDNVRGIPREKGDKVTLILEKTFTRHRTAKIADGPTIEWDEIPTIDEMGMPVKQVLRRNNGLNLMGTTMVECAKELCELFDDENHLTLEIADIKYRDYPNGTAQYIIWRIPVKEA
jgi:hypothetical protein